MDFIRPIGPAERDIDPAQRVERLRDERERRQPEQEQEQKRKKGSRAADRGSRDPALPAPVEGPVEGDDGHLHIDIRA